ncbi:hypothetical protein BBP40_008648 [Aspergillus hancockii]|nr:hypothetical protein BBP40_008648 [Aspergillus hancockii]
MRTRSQQASPGGFISLDSEPAARRTRSTRSASQTNTQPSSSTQPTARSKAGNKATTNGAARKTTRKAPKRATRKSTRKTVNRTSGDGEGESHNEESAGTASQDDKENVQEDPKDHESVTQTRNAILSESKSSSISREYTPEDLPGTGLINPPEH